MNNGKLEESLALARERLEKRKAEEARALSSEKNTEEDLPEVSPEWEELAPELDSDNTAEQAQAEIQDENEFIRSLNIRTVYTRLTGVNPGQDGKHESIMVRCVAPGHVDEKPSAWLNDLHGYYNCATCEFNTGTVGMIAASLGYNPNKGQLRGEQFQEAKNKLFKMFDFKPAQQILDEIIASKFKDTEPETTPVLVNTNLVNTNTATPPKLTVVKQLQPPSLDDTDDTDLDDTDEFQLPSLENVLATLPKNTFLHEYILAGSSSRAPDEYFLAGGLQILAAALGPFVRGDFGGDFKLAMSVLRVGPTGNYKSMTDVASYNILNSGNFTWEPYYTKGSDYAEAKGVRIVGNIGSGEYYIEQLSQVSIDNTVYKVRDVTCWIVNDEFSGFMTRADSRGNTTKELFMQDESRVGLNDWIQTGSRSAGTLTAINPLRLFSSSIQTESMKDIAGDRNIDNGFLSRLCIFGGVRKPGIRARDNTVSDLTRAIQKAEEIRRIYSMFRSVANTGAPDNRELWKMRFTDDAADLFEQYEYNLDTVKSYNNMLSRIDLHFKRIAVLMAVNNLHEEVESLDVELAWWVVQYLIKTADALLGKMRVTEKSEIQEIIIKKLKNVYLKPARGKNYMVLSQIMNACDIRKTKGWKEDDYLAALETLVNSEQILITESTARNIPKKRYLWRDPDEEKQDIGKDQRLAGPTRISKGARNTGGNSGSNSPGRKGKG